MAYSQESFTWPMRMGCEHGLFVWFIRMYSDGPVVPHSRPHTDFSSWSCSPVGLAPHYFRINVLWSCCPQPRSRTDFTHSRPRTDFALQCCGPVVPVPDRFCIRVSHHNFASWFRGPAGPRSRGPALIRIAVPQSQSRSHNDFASRSHGLGPYVYVKKTHKSCVTFAL
jgi:hypothetical protein